jgi:hypothetical protein
MMGIFRMRSLKSIFSRFTSMAALIALLTTGMVAIQDAKPAHAAVTITKTFAGSTWSLVAGYHGANQAVAAADAAVRSLFTTAQNNNLSSLSSVLATTGTHYSNDALYSQVNNGYLLEGYTDAGVERNVKAVISTANHTWNQLGSAAAVPNMASAFTVNSSQLYNSAGTPLTTTYGYVGASSGTSASQLFSDDSGDFILLGATNGSQNGGDSFDTTFNSGSYAIGIGVSDGTGTGQVIKTSYSQRGGSNALTINDSAGSSSHSGNTATGWVMVWVRGAGPVASTAPAITPASSGKVGATYTATNGTWSGSGTVTDVSARWQISSDNATWTDISGATASTYTPTSSDAGKYLRWAVTKSDNNGTTTVGSTATLLITTTPVFTAATPTASGTISTALTSYTFAASGGRVTYAIASGALPAGVTLSAAGVLAGTPTANGTFTYVVSATNESGSVNTPSQTLTINQAPAWTANAPTLALLTGTATSYTFTASGYPAPTFSVTSGTLPAGLTLTSAGVLSGTPTAVGSSTVTFSASNGIGTAATVSKTFSVTAGVQATLYANASSTTLTYDPTNQPTTTVSTTGGSGTGAVTYVVQAGSGSVCSISGTTVTAITAGSCTIVATKASDANYGSATATVTITIDKANQSALVAATSATSFTYSTSTQTAALSTTGGNGTGAVTYAVAVGSSTVCSISGNTATILNAGTCVINATKAADTNYLVQTASVTLTIAQANQVALTANAAAPTLNYNATTAPTTTLSTTGGSGTGAVSYSVAEGSIGICSVSGTTVTTLTAGVCEIIATKAASTNYVAQTGSVTITINKIAQSAFTATAAASTLNYNATTPATTTVSTSGGSGTGLVSLAIANGSVTVCSIEGNTVIALTAGSCVIEVSKAGDTNYLAKTASVTVTINKIAQSNFAIDATSTSLTYAASPAVTTEFSITGGNGAGAESVAVASSSALICSIDGNTVTVLSAGTCVLNATKASDTNYLFATESVTITIAKASQTDLAATATRSSITITGTNTTSELSFTGGSGTGASTWSIDSASVGICSLSGTTVTAVASGTCVINLVKVADTNYLQATDSLTISVSAALQSALTIAAAETSLTFSSTDLTFTTVSISGGNGTGRIWFETVNADKCVVGAARNTANGIRATVTALHAGTCEVRGHKDGDANFAPAESSAIEIIVAKGTQSELSLSLESPLTYSVNPIASTHLRALGGSGSGSVAYSLVSGPCTLVANELAAPNAGDCVVRATKAADQDFTELVTESTFTVAKANQASLSLDLAEGSISTIAWDGKKNSALVVSGGTGSGALSATSSSTEICTVSVTGSTVTATGVSSGTCSVTVTKAASANYLAKSSTFEFTVIDLPSAPSNVTIINTGVVTDDGTAVEISWTPIASSGTQAEVTGYEVQFKSGLNWVRADGGLVDAQTSSLTVYPTPWTALFIRVAPVSTFDAEDGVRHNWTNYTGTTGGSAPVAFNIAGRLDNISSPIVAASSGEPVIINGTDFDQAKTNQVEITTSSAVLPARLGVAAITTAVKTVPAIVISPTKLSFVVPKITLPTGSTQLAATVRVLSTSGVRSEPVSFNYVPKKLAQTIAVSGLPSSPNLVVGTAVNGSLGALGAVPSATGTTNICSAAIGDNGALSITPIAKGKCVVTIQAPATPGYAAASAKVLNFTVLGVSQTLTFADPADRVWDDESFAVPATAGSNLPVSVTSTTPLICSVVDLAVTMLKSGVCTLKATQAGSAGFEAAAPVTQSFTIAKANRSANLTATIQSLAVDGTEADVVIAASPGTPTQANVTVAIGTDPLDRVVTLSQREGTVLFTVDSADDATGRCVADAGTADSLEGVITLTDLGSCKVTISQPADDRFNAGVSVVIWINAVAINSNVTVPDDVDTGDAVDSTEDTDSTPADPDSEPAVALTLPGTGGTFDVGGDVGIGYNPTTGVLSINTKTAFVGTFKVSMNSPAANKKWFTVSKKAVASCVLTLTVKKDAKLKKSVVRVIGTGCALSAEGKAALTAVGIQKVKIAYVFNRAYAKTGLAYMGTAKAKTRILSKVKRTIVLKVGRVS